MDFFNIAANFGVAVACLVFLGGAVWVCVRWLAANIITPGFQRFMKFLDELSLALASQGQALQTMAIHQARETEGNERLVEKMEEVLKLQGEILQAVRTAKHLDVRSDSVVVHQEAKPRGGA